MTSEEAVTPDRMNAFSDGVFAVIITILVLELRPPKEANFGAFLDLWPAWVSYAISYLFIAIVWVNHHHLLRFPDVATHRLIWGNFGHLFAVSLMPFSTAWIASTRLGAVPVAFYAAVFFLVNVTYLLLCLEAVDRSAPHKVEPRARSMMRMRSFATLGVFAAAGVVALRYPIGGMAMICLCLIVYLSPGAPGATRQLKSLEQAEEESFYGRSEDGSDLCTCSRSLGRWDELAQGDRRP